MRVNVNKQRKALDILYQFYKIESMSQQSEQASQLYEERLQTQTETNQQINNLINEARNDPKKFLPYGPPLMNIYSPERIQAYKSALYKSIEDEKKSYCYKQCKGKEECVNKCETFYSWACNYGLGHFEALHKYAYIPTIREDEE